MSRWTRRPISIFDTRMNWLPKIQDFPGLGNAAERREHDRRAGDLCLRYGSQPGAAGSRTIRQHVRLDKSLRPGKKLAALVSPYEKTEIPLPVTSNRTRTYGVEVDVNGRKLKLILDTGAGGIVIQRSAAGEP